MQFHVTKHLGRLNAVQIGRASAGARFTSQAKHNSIASSTLVQPSRSTPNLEGKKGPSVHSFKRREFVAMATSSDFPAVVEADWLNERLNQADIKILDGSWYLPDSGKNGEQEFLSERIPGSQYFNMNKVADLKSSLPHMLPSPEAFSSVLDALKISNNDTVIVYDRSGIFSAPRIWWTFKAFGHQKVAVLNGGFPQWQAKGFKIDKSKRNEEEAKISAKAAENPSSSTSYKANLKEALVRSKADVLKNLDSKQEKVIDARGAPRFKGEAQEPRPGMKKGHIPNSVNVPYPNLLKDGRFKSESELKEAFSQAGLNFEQPIISSCGSGVTACILALGLYQIDPKIPVAVYDGSWSEWGSSKDTPVQSGS